ncbi:Uncharacterised protein [Helicobacter pametensis]|nr:Uncharacterised protein [Helicobacter pametensis]
MSQSPYPSAAYPEKVGIYPAHCHSGSGYFYDDVLEYRVWCHPERGVPDLYEGDDYFHAFATMPKPSPLPGNNPAAKLRSSSSASKNMSTSPSPAPSSAVPAKWNASPNGCRNGWKTVNAGPDQSKPSSPNRLPESDILAKPRQSFCGAKTKPQ